MAASRASVATTFFGEVIVHRLNRLFQPWNVTLENLPHDVQIDAQIIVHKQIAKSADSTPLNQSLRGFQLLGKIWKISSRFSRSGRSTPVLVSISCTRPALPVFVVSPARRSVPDQFHSYASSFFTTFPETSVRRKSRPWKR
jgi:hypothetical protein